jgi:hypothetical protein
LNLNVHFHMLALDGVYVDDAYGKIRLHRIKPPTVDELGALAHRISHRVAKFLERRGFLERDEENTYLHLEISEDEAMQQLYGHSITYRIALGPHQGRKVFTLHKMARNHFGRWSAATAAPRERGEAHGGAEQTYPRRKNRKRLRAGSPM